MTGWDTHKRSCRKPIQPLLTIHHNDFCQLVKLTTCKHSCKTSWLLLQPSLSELPQALPNSEKPPTTVRLQTDVCCHSVIFSLPSTIHSPSKHSQTLRVLRATTVCLTSLSTPNTESIGLFVRIVVCNILHGRASHECVPPRWLQRRSPIAKGDAKETEDNARFVATARAAPHYSSCGLALTCIATWTQCPSHFAPGPQTATRTAPRSSVNLFSNASVLRIRSVISFSRAVL